MVSLWSPSVPRIQGLELSIYLRNTAMCERPTDLEAQGDDNPSVSSLPDKPIYSNSMNPKKPAIANR